MTPIYLLYNGLTRKRIYKFVDKNNKHNKFYPKPGDLNVNKLRLNQ